MNRYLFKIKHIIPLCSVVLLTAAVGYGLFKWLLAFGIAVYAIKSEVFGYILPAILSGVIFWVTLRKRFWIIEERKVRQVDYRGFLQSVTWIALYVIMMFAEGYIERQSGTSLAADAVILRPLTDGYVNRGDEILRWILGAFAIWITLTLILLSFSPLNDKLLTKKLTWRQRKKIHVVKTK